MEYQERRFRITYKSLGSGEIHCTLLRTTDPFYAAMPAQIEHQRAFEDYFRATGRELIAVETLEQVPIDMMTGRSCERPSSPAAERGEGQGSVASRRGTIWLGAVVPLFRSRGMSR